MTITERIQNEISRHEEMLEEIAEKPLWYQHSTTGREKKKQYEYTLSVLNNLIDI